MRLGFIGAGRMGLPMVQRLTAAGHEVRALGRTPAARSRIARAAPGVRSESGIREVAENSEAVLVCVFSDDQVREVCLATPLLDALAPDAVVVVHTTGSPATVEAIAAQGARVVDAPVSGGPHDIAAGRLTLFSGGADDAVRHVLPALAAYADPVLHVGPLGSGQRLKLLNNALFAAQLGLLGETVRFAAALGVDETALLTALPHASAESRVARAAAARGSVAAFTDSVRSFLEKDIAVVREVATELGTDLGLLEVAIRTAHSKQSLRHQGDTAHGTC
ncbi:3-hydroxyisobutyrate dehydrogenase-like beta-hydroxyacid dehydrogenase [Streptomyces sp. SAI-144]|uniref:NAD(P)-dependent oxidoreductase n=1 Tax=Streptomyces sp. SAI-144 TaxID=2940544 RepID=UPI0024765C3F|nr:NAD(P)-dependent oxidoreductase [Streptomyces sp. SAI-144]MDH6436729.1 3-hydroxyisobutyrate dehydrogenase-like beta-hydroxyacid dehydrogenase [Streptomyces sp. SAI-144]